jgi:hypothetical protein
VTTPRQSPEVIEGSLKTETISWNRKHNGNIGGHSTRTSTILEPSGTVAVKLP